MPDLKFFVPGTPVAKGRPKFSARGGFARVYTPKKTVDYEALVAKFAAEAMAGREPFTGPLSLSVRAYWPWPKSISKKRRKIVGWHWKVTKADLDNVVKAIGDGAEGVVWANDSQIVEYTDHVKQFSDVPGVWVTVEKLAKG